MSVFDTFSDMIVPAKFSRVDRKNPLGATASAEIDVKIIIDEGSSTTFTGQTVDTRNNDVLIYASRNDSVLNSRKCVGGFLRTTSTLDPRKFRIEDWNVGGYEFDGGHIELSATEVSA